MLSSRYNIVRILYRPYYLLLFAVATWYFHNSTTANHFSTSFSQDRSTNRSDLTLYHENERSDTLPWEWDEILAGNVSQVVMPPWRLQYCIRSLDCIVGCVVAVSWLQWFYYNGENRYRTIIMDLLGDLGHADQLYSTREENKVLQVKVKELTVPLHRSSRGGDCPWS